MVAHTRCRKIQHALLSDRGARPTDKSQTSARTPLRGKRVATLGTGRRIRAADDQTPMCWRLASPNICDGRRPLLMPPPPPLLTDHHHGGVWGSGGRPGSRSCVPSVRCAVMQTGWRRILPLLASGPTTVPVGSLEGVPAGPALCSRGHCWAAIWHGWEPSAARRAAILVLDGGEGTCARHTRAGGAHGLCISAPPPPPLLAISTPYAAPVPSPPLSSGPRCVLCFFSATRGRGGSCSVSPPFPRLPFSAYPRGFPPPVC